MKRKLLGNRCRASHRRGRGGQAAALLAAVAISVCTAVRLEAAVIDDFEGPVKFDQGSGYGNTNYFQWGIADGQLLISKQSPIGTPRDNVLQRYDNVYWPAPRLPAGNLDDGRTLELRVDLIHSSADDLFLMLMCGGPTDGADSLYSVIMDRNEVGLMKYKYGGMTTFYWDTLATANENVNVRLAFTKIDSSLAITVKVVDKGNQGATLYERTFVDGPGQDGPVPPPDPHGFGFFTNDLGAPLTNFTYAAVGCVQVIFVARPPPLEMRLDNLEYYVNQVPVADAGATELLYISPNGLNASVTLDGSRSSDPDGDVLEYFWFSTPKGQPATLLASGAQAVAVLPMGINPIELVVSDSWASATNAISIEVITTAEGVERLIALTQSEWRRHRPLMVSLYAALHSIERGNRISAVNQLHAFQNKVRAQVSRSDPALAATLTEAAQEITEALKGSQTRRAGWPKDRFTVPRHEPTGRVEM